MKRLIIIVLSLVSSLVNAQDSHLKSNVATMVQKEDKLIVNFTSDNWANLPSYITAKPFRSRGFSFMFMNEEMNKTGTFGVGLGLGFMSQNVHTDGVFVDATGNDSAYVMQKIPDSLSYNVNKLSLNFLTAALEFRLRTKENIHGERFKLSFGFLAALLLQSHTKYSDDEQKIKTFKVKHLNDVQYGFEGRIGYSNYALSGYYSLVNVFEDKEGPELTPYSIGITFTF
jgi:hypothetical protein